MKNFPFEHNGEKLWYSRSMACTCYIFVKDKKTREWYVLMNQRGPGCPTNVGKWNVPGGYLDFDETLRECVVRETHEETGLYIDEENVELIGIDSNPNYNKSQNVVFTYCVNLGKVKDIRNIKLSKEYSENDEVDYITWVPVKIFYDCNYEHNLSCIRNHTAYHQDVKIANIFLRYVKPSWKNIFDRL